MIRKESYKHVNQIMSVIHDDKYTEMWRGIATLAGLKEISFTLMPAIINPSADSSVSAANNIANLKNKVIKVVNDPLVGVAVIFRSVIELSGELKNLFNRDESVFNVESECLYHALEDFIKAYTEFASNGNKLLVIHETSHQAGLLMNSKERLELLDSFTISLMGNKTDGHGNSIELYLSNVESLNSFSLKVNAIASIYSKIMPIISASENDEPLIIEHLEYGSFWLRFSGNELATAIIVAIIPLVGGYLHNEYSLSGQIKEKSEAITALQKLVDLEGKLKESGVDTSEMHEQIVASSKSVARDTYDLLYDQADIEINDKVLSVGEDVKHNLIEQSKTLKLGHYEGEDPLGPN